MLLSREHGNENLKQLLVKMSTYADVTHVTSSVATLGFYYQLDLHTVTIEFKGILQTRGFSLTSPL